MMSLILNEFLFEQFAEMPIFASTLCAVLPREMLIVQPRNDLASLAEHVWHLRDCETDLYARRIDAMLQADNPTLPVVFIKEWLIARAYLVRPVADALSGFAAARTAFIERLRTFGPRELARQGTRADGKVYTIADVIEEMAAHDREHRLRMAAVLTDFAAFGLPVPEAAALRR